MKHISIINYGSFLGIKSSRLVVYENKIIVGEFPLNRIKTITINKKGVSLSSDLIFEAGSRGIRIFFINYKTTVSLSGSHQHAVAKIREAQFDFVNNNSKRMSLASKLIAGKIKNQRSLLLSYKKYHIKEDSSNIHNVCDELKNLINNLSTIKKDSHIFGIEGVSAKLYWSAIREMGLSSKEFNIRTGRNASDIFNKALNYGYAILQSYVWNAVLNAGLEPYVGVLHVQRAGKPSLILDVMEEYRPWVVDRNIITLRSKLDHVSDLTPDIKKAIVSSIHKSFAKRYLYKKSKLKLESILQRQVYNLVATIKADKNYKSYIFKW